MMMKTLLAAAVSVGLGLGTGAASAATALTSQNTAGNQDWPGALGMDFDVVSSILVTKLGAFDDLRDGFAGSIQVGIFDRDTGFLVGSSATLTGSALPLVGSDRFFDVADFTLAAGHYSIVAVGFSASDRNSNVNQGATPSTIDTGGGLISFVGGSRYNNFPNFGVLALPSIVDGGPANRYDAGTFVFQAAPVPEPGALALMLAGLGAVGVVARRRRPA